MANIETIEAPEIAAIHRQYLPDAVDIHACRQSGVVDLYTLDIVYNKQRSPAIVDFATIWQKVEVTLDHAGQATRLGEAQTEAIFVERTG
jgi:hypothetical protein